MSATNQSLYFVVTLLIPWLAGADGPEASNTDAPMTYLVVVDVSGSMKGKLPVTSQPVLSNTSKLQDVKNRLSLLTKLLPDNTRVLVTQFDHEAVAVCDLQLKTTSDRQALLQAFASLRCREGSTFLWRTADAQLKRAQEIAATSPQGRVRMLLYTDGEDMEKTPGLNHHTIVQKYGKVLQSVVELDWVTLGYDIKADTKADLQNQGVRFTRAMQPDDIVPLRAAFRLSETDVIAGDQITAADNSLGVEITQHSIDWGDNTVLQMAAPFRHRFTTAGTFVVCYSVTSKNGRTSTAKQQVHVRLPAAPVAKFRVSQDEIVLGDSLQVTDLTTGDINLREWRLDGVVVSSEAVAKLKPQQTGEHSIQLLVTDGYGQTSETVKTVIVRQPAAPKAAFRFSTASAKPGDTVTLINESTSSAVTFDWVVGEDQFHEQHVTFVVRDYGDVLVKLKVSDSFGQSAMVTQVLSVPKPPAPVADFRIPESVKPGTTLTIIDQSTGIINGDGEWTLNGDLVGSDSPLEFFADIPGQYEICRIVNGPGGRSQQRRTLVVSSFDPPHADFTVGNRKPVAGDEIVITDTSQGPIDRVVFQIDGDETPILLRDIGTEIRKSFVLPCPSAGAMLITQIASGPGGTDQKAVTLNVAPCVIEPRACYVVEAQVSSGSTDVIFRSESTGTILKSVFDPRDGSSIQTFDGAADFRHRYGPGEWKPMITVYGPAGCPPSVWTSESPITVSEPLPDWVWQLLWQIPAGLAACVAMTVVVQRQRSAAIIRMQRLLNGELTVRLATDPRSLRHFSFEGRSDTETVHFDEQTTLQLTSQQGDWSVLYSAELVLDGPTSESVDLTDGDEHRVGSLLISYAP